MMTDRKTNRIPTYAACAGIYIHIPFCVRKCQYCDFLSFPASGQIQDRYADQLDVQLREICRSMKEQGQTVSSIYFGGGTPSILPGKQIVRFMNTLRSCGNLSPDTEITLEMNPGTVTEKKLFDYRDAGINRLSMGVQSFQNEELKILGRIHTSADVYRTFHMMRLCGFSNISLDLMSGLPGQSLESWQDTLNRAIDLGPEHISAYSLIVEEGTPFYESYGESWAESEEHEELDRLMYEDTGRILKKAGYDRYEISNYARSGRESRHNSSYWTGIPYYGCGLGASSLICREGKWYRTRNLSRMDAYLKNPLGLEESELLTEQARMEEFMFLGLRLTAGIDPQEFENRFQRDFYEIYGAVVSELEEDGLLKTQHSRIFLTERGLDLSNYCFEKFLL